MGRRRIDRHTHAAPTDATFAGAINYLANAFAGRVNAWEIWNEEDSTAWWTGTPAQYVGLLKAAYPAVKSADPSASVLVGGLTGNDASYLQALYASGAQGSFDAVGVHTDTACNVTSPTVFEFDRGTQRSTSTSSSGSPRSTPRWSPPAMAPSRST